MKPEAPSKADFDPERGVRPEDARRALLDAGLALFNERFLDQITLEDLAARAGCSVDAAVDVFGGQENIFPEIARDLAGRMPSARFSVPELGPFLQLGRALHRDWIETWFADALSGLETEQRRLRIAQLAAVCDVTLWHKLRSDLGLSPAEARAAVINLVEALLAAPPAE